MVGAYQFLKKYGVTISVIVGLLLSVVMFVVCANGPAESEGKKVLYAAGAYDFALYVSYFLSILACIIMPPIMLIFSLVRDPKTASKGLITMGAIFAVFMVMRMMAGGEIRPEHRKVDPNLTEGIVKTLEASLYLSYALFFLSIAVVIFSAIYGAVKNARS